MSRPVLICLVFMGFSTLALAQKDSLEFITYYYETGTKSSEGYLRDGKPDGYWKSFYRNGNLKAEGNREMYLLEGPWIFYNEDGEKTVEISYEQGQKNGLQKTFREGVVVKEENYVNEKLQGFTSLYFMSGALMEEIPFVDGKEKGEGYGYEEDGRITTLYTYKAGVLTRKQRINRYDEAGLQQGIWMNYHKNRQVSEEGPYVNGLKHGYWKYYQPNGNLKRVEKWVMGELQQDATEVAKIEIRREIDPQTGKLAFKGAYRNGKPEGVHRRYDDEGNVIESKIFSEGIMLFEGIVDEEGRRQGPWKEYYSSGELKSEGSYKDNLKIGNWKYYYINGDLEQTGDYQRGLASGLWTWYYPNGQVWREEEYFMGQEEGISTEYSDSGTVLAKGNYIEGLRDGKWFFEIHDHREEGRFFEGERTGEWKHYYLKDNQLRFEGKFENNLENGMHTYYYANGQVKRRGSYSLGEREGIWEFFTETGYRTISIEYENGQEIKYNGQRIRYGRRYDRAKKKEESAAEDES